jgi:hypothetical protein
MPTRLRWTALLALLAACGPASQADSEPAASADSAPAAPPPGSVDSTFAPDEALRRFRDGVPEPRALTAGAASRDALVREFVSALARQDTAALIAMHITRAEFAWLYYPHSPTAQPGRYLDPKTMWFLLSLESEKGLTRLMQRLGGKGAGLRALACEPEPRIEGPNRLWEQCRLTLRDTPPDFRAERLFGTILERGGRFKFVSFKTDL